MSFGALQSPWNAQCVIRRAERVSGADMSENKKKANPIVNYFKDVKGEMKKVAWPTFKQVKNNTIIVIVAVIIVGAIIALLDLGFGKGFEFIVNKPEQTEQVEGQTENIVVDDAEIGGEAVEIDLDDATDAGEEADAQAGEEDAE